MYVGCTIAGVYSQKDIQLFTVKLPDKLLRLSRLRAGDNAIVMFVGRVYRNVCKTTKCNDVCIP